MRFTFCLLALLLLVPPAQAIELCGAGKRHQCVIDGDTFWWRGTKVRIRDLDTPEIDGARCSAERRQGLAARDALLELLNRGTVRVDRGELDIFGRPLVQVTVQGEDVASFMIEQGFGRPYDGGRKPWC